MGDVYCKQCGEPWDYLGLRDNEERWEDVLYGKGCPVCDWGEDDDRVAKRKEDEMKNKIKWLESINNETDLDPMKYYS